ncbi:restriction endonuclease [Marinirhabdus gelatinilytica]|uniref:Restriction system protein n=1 Tax=Marinirhabdus gelatinilytica TaxID=1703343 RepID=A0A370QAS1_9FLAO|nr:restriction endonuclease [Marinirhabdus gelatinilytica]RDK85457.1 restriction system protein [Marinirhabdus gelatinilytica]
MTKRKEDFKVWMVRAGSGSWLLDDFLTEEVVAIGWNDLGELEKGLTLEKLKKRLVENYPDDSKGRIGQSAGQIWRLYRDFKVGDKVITYDSDARMYYIGEIKSGYKFSEKLKYQHHRKVKWEEIPIERDLLKVSSKNTLGSILTIFEVPKEIWNELREAHPYYIPQEQIDEQEELLRRYEEQELEQLKEDVVYRSTEFIKDIITKLSASELEELSAGIMRGMGYKTRMTKKGGGDLGSDIMVSPDGLSMIEPIIKVEVKHKIKSKDKVSAPEIRNFVGGLRVTTKGIYISSTGFSKEAQYEAERANFHITLIDLDYLVELIIEYYEKLDSETKSLVPLRAIYWPL